MLDERLKLILTLLGGVIFAMLFILLALVIPIKKNKVYHAHEKPKTKLEKISHGVKQR
jgi:hypothetical protein